MRQFPATSSSSIASQSTITARLHMSSDSEANKSSILVSLPSEIPIKFLSEVPLSCFLALAHISRGLRSFVEDNAARICNKAIRSRFAHAVKTLEATTNYNLGGLLPGPAKLNESEDCTWRLSLVGVFGGSIILTRKAPGLYLEECTIRKPDITLSNVADIPTSSILGPKWNYKNVTPTPTNNFPNFGRLVALPLASGFSLTLHPKTRKGYVFHEDKV